MVAADLVRRGECRDGLEHERRADRIGAVAEQPGEVMGLAGLVALDDDATRPCAGRRRRAAGARRRSRAASGSGRARRTPRSLSRSSSGPVGDGRLGRAGQAHAGGRPRPSPGVEGRIEPTAASSCSTADGIEEEALQLEQPRRLGALARERRACAEQRPKRHDEPLAQVVDRPGWSPARSAGGSSSQSGRARPASGAAPCRRPSTRSGSCALVADRDGGSSESSSRV